MKKLILFTFVVAITIVPNTVRAATCIDGQAEVWFNIEYCNKRYACLQICLTEQTFNSPDAPLIVARFAEAYSLGKDSVQHALSVFAYHGGFRDKKKFKLDHISIRAHCVQSVERAANAAC